MASNKDYNLFQLANDLLDRKKFVESNEVLKKLISSKKYHDFALLSIARNLIRFGDYVEVRKLLSENEFKNIGELNELWGIVELTEFNIQESIKYFNRCLDYNYKLESIINKLSSAYMIIGEYKYSEIMLESLKLNEQNKIDATIGLINLYLFAGDYDKALKTVNSVNVDLLNREDFEKFKRLRTLTLYHLGMLGNESPHDFLINAYSYELFMNDDDKKILSHLQKHYDKDYNNVNLFFKQVNRTKLLNTVRDRIQGVNPNFHSDGEIYRVRLDDYVGTCNLKSTKDVCVVKAINTDKIMTVYPVLLSDKYDSEGYVKSRELKLKRERGI